MILNVALIEFLKAIPLTALRLDPDDSKRPLLLLKSPLMAYPPGIDSHACESGSNFFRNKVQGVSREEDAAILAGTLVVA